jgi:hypothetical protein
MRRIRYLALAALGVFAALPVARVYTAGAPWIDRMEIRDNDLVGLRGRGVPGTQIDIYYRQRNFRQGVFYCLPPATCITFGWCDWLNGGNALYLGSPQVSGAGTWQLGGLDLQVLPGVAQGPTCATGVGTQIELRSQYGDVSVPEISLGLLQGQGGLFASAVGAIWGADRVALGVADGPNAVQNATSPWTIDTAEDGVDLCTNAACGSIVQWGYGIDGPLKFLAPRIEVRDDSPLTGPRDQEFGHVMGMLQGHKPGGSILAVAYVPRPTPVGPALDVNVDMNGASVEGAGCDAAGGYFEFFP